MVLEAKFNVMLRLCHADPRLRHVRNITATFPEDDNCSYMNYFRISI